MLINANSNFIPLQSGSVQMCVTSPPYLGLRMYQGTAKWTKPKKQVFNDAGEEIVCQHQTARKKTRFDYPLSEKQRSNKGSEVVEYDPTCPTCGAELIDDQIGREKVHDCYGWTRGEDPCDICFVCSLRRVFAEVRRVLKPSGTLWLNLGDSYNGSGGSGGQYNPGGIRAGQPKVGPTKIKGLKPKDMCGIPWLTAMALRADGWYLRRDIIWFKTNAFPEGGAKDRPSVSHEYIFLMSKGNKSYFDLEAARMMNNGKNMRTVWEIPVSGYKGAHYATFPLAIPKMCIAMGSRPGDIVLDPFVGSGTSIVAAMQADRIGIGLDLSMDYLVNDAKKRIGETPWQLRLV